MIVKPIGIYDIMKADELQIVIKGLSSRLTDLTLIGEGSLSSIFRAQDSIRAKTCVLKIYHKGPPYLLKAYAKHLLNIQNSVAGDAPTGLLIPYETGEYDGIYYELLDYVAGVRDLNYVIESGGLPLIDAFGVLCQIADGLNYLHSKNLIHADVKPSNILISHDGDTKAT